jgi:hypothetical protein
MSHAMYRTSMGRRLLAAVLLTFLAGLPQIVAAQDITGEWAVTMDFNGRPSYATLTLTKNPDGTLAGKWGSDALSNVKLDGQKLTFVRTVRFGDNEFTMDYAGTVTDGKITGNMSSDRGEFPANAVKRKPMPAIVGVWNLSYSVGDRDMTATLTISQKPDGALDAKWASQMGETVISNVKGQDNKITFDRTVKFNDQEFTMTFEGTAQGDKLTGVSKSDMGEVPVTGTRFGADLIGKWELTTVSDFGTRTIMMTINPDLSGRYESFGGETPMKNVKFENGQLTFDLETGWGDRTFNMDFKGKVDGKTLKGEMNSDRGTTEITGKKLPATAPAAPAPAATGTSSIVGTWEFTRQGRDGTPRTSTLKINPDMTGTYTMRDNPTPISDLKVDGNQVSFKITMSFGGNEFTQDFKGTVDGQTLKGAFISERGEREAVGKKVQ